MDFGKQLAKESRFSGAAGSCHNNRGEVPGRFSDHIIQISKYVSHVSILRYNFRIINNKGLTMDGAGSALHSGGLLGPFARSPVAQWYSIRLLTILLNKAMHKNIREWCIIIP